VTSSKSKKGREELLDFIDTALKQHKKWLVLPVRTDHPGGLK
jgi:hypothetical protein